jgi:hypothetical protein
MTKKQHILRNTYVRTETEMQLKDFIGSFVSNN